MMALITCKKSHRFSPSGEVTQVARCLLGSIVMGRPGLELCRAYLDSVLYSTDRRKIEADDDMEGTFY
jgi:hypothetical protein